jgi:hypothetical protein
VGMAHDEIESGTPGMRLSLRCHPDSRCESVTAIDVDVEQPRPGTLMLRYGVMGTISGLSLPPMAAPARTDGLWRHACFEVFVRAPPNDAYYELNLSPSTQWAAYAFSSYRTGMSAANEVPDPMIGVQADAAAYELHASLGLDGLAFLPIDRAWRLGLSAVIEETSGLTSYWALAHPPGKPDFHHPDCFAFELPTASRP